jgi:hypothetical protein
MASGKVNFREVEKSAAKRIPRTKTDVRYTDMKQTNPSEHSQKVAEISRLLHSYGWAERQML